MVDFSQLLKKPAGEAKKPKALIAGDFPAKIKSHEFGDQNKNKTPYVRYHLALTGWPETASEEDKVGEDGKPVDLSKKTLRRDFFLTDDSLFRLDEFLRAIGVDMNGRSYEEAIPDAVGADVLAEVQQYMNQSTGDIGNQIGDLKALS